MSQTAALHIAYWGLRKGNINLSDIQQSLQKQQFTFTQRENFKAFDPVTRQRHPILVSGEIGLVRANRADRLKWDVPQAINEVFQWLESEQGEPWRDNMIRLFVPESKDQSLLWLLLNEIVVLFTKQNKPYPENLIITEADDAKVLQHLQAGSRDAPELIILADSLLDSEYVGGKNDIATEMSGSGRVLSEAVTWVALTPNPEAASFHAQFTTSELNRGMPSELVEPCQQWLQQHYQVGNLLFLNHDVPLLLDPITREQFYFKHCVPASTIPTKAPDPKDKQAVKAFEEALENAEPIDHNIEKNTLNLYLGDCGLAKILASLVVTMEHMTKLATGNQAVVYQESSKVAYHYLIQREPQTHYGK